MGPVTALIGTLLLLCQTAVADSEFTRGMALAREQRWEEARQAFEDGRRKEPLDKRFPLELAGVAFRQMDYRAAKRYLGRALQLDPGDSYAAGFLATIYLLEQNTEAALEYWNRAGEPRIEEIRTEPEPRLDPVLLDRAFAFSPAALLTLEEYRTTEARLDLLDVFAQRRFELLPRDDGRYDVLFRSTERRGWLSLLRGLPFQSVQPEFHDLRGSGIAVAGMLRWDSEKRRVFGELSGPLWRDPSRRYRIYADGRNENWQVRGLGGFNLEKMEVGAEVESVVNSRWSWAAGASVATRRFRNSALAGGPSLKSEARLGCRLLDIPEKRLTVDSAASWQLGRTFAESLGLFSKAQGSLTAHWFPQASGEDYATTARIRAGKTLGPVPFDELFMLGLERDNDLWLRGHIGTQHGQKGSAPLGRDYVLTNWETDKLVYSAALFTVKVGPFLDSGRAYDRSLGSREWLWDAGVQSKLRVVGGLTLIVSYGKDLRGGRNAFYVTVSP